LQRRKSNVNGKPRRKERSEHARRRPRMLSGGDGQGRVRSGSGRMRRRDGIDGTGGRLNGRGRIGIGRRGLGTMMMLLILMMKSHMGGERGGGIVRDREARNGQRRGNTVPRDLMLIETM
jgi:hypothetical protein